MSRVLVVEDNESLAVGLSRSLGAAGYEATVAGDRAGARRALERDEPDLMILDLMLPDADGFEVLQDLRARGSTIPVLILSARGQEIDKVRGFRLGADDYVVKPVGVLELLARVEALLRRAGGGRRPADDVPGGPVTLGAVEVDPARRTVARDGEPIELAPQEFELLLCLLAHEGRAVARETLLREAWGYRNPVPTRTVDTHISTLRAKIEDDPARPRHILTVRKVGYRLVV